MVCLLVLFDLSVADLLCNVGGTSGEYHLRTCVILVCMELSCFELFGMALRGWIWFGLYLVGLASLFALVGLLVLLYYCLAFLGLG